MDNKIKRIKIQQKITILSNFSLLRISGVSTSSGSIQRESPLHIYNLISTVIYKDVFTKDIFRGVGILCGIKQDFGSFPFLFDSGKSMKIKSIA